MTLLSNTSLAMSNSSYVFAQQSVYTSLELYALIFAAFLILLGYSLHLDPVKYIFEKFISALMAFSLSLSILIGSFSLAKMEVVQAGTVATAISPSIGMSANTYAIVPTMIMQNTQTLSITIAALGIMTFVYLLHCIFLLVDISRSTVAVGGRREI